MIQSTLNNIILRIHPKWIKNMTNIMRVAVIQNNTSLEAADLVNIVGEVVSVPLEISKWRREYRTYSANDIKVGDTAIFSHDVIYSFVQEDPEAEPIYKNSFWYKGEELWTCNILNLYAVIREGEIRMQNGYVMVGNMEANPKIVLPNYIKKAKSAATGTITEIEMNPTLKRGDTIFYNRNHLRIYQINGKEFGILKRNQVLGHEYRLTKKYNGQLSEKFPY